MEVVVEKDDKPSSIVVMYIYIYILIDILIYRLSIDIPLVGGDWNMNG